jgi:hypothetical protein
MSNKNVCQWKAAIRSGLTSRHYKCTFRMADPLLGRHTIGNKWVFKVKSNPGGSVNRFKARLVAQGFSLCHCVDYPNTFFSAVKLSTLRIVIALTMATRGMHAHLPDIETAFLNVYLQEKIFMRQQKGAAYGTPRVLRLLKSIYGLKHASREWYSLFNTTLTTLGLKHSTYDANLYSVHHPVHGISVFSSMSTISSLSPITSTRSPPLRPTSASSSP